MRDPRRWRSEFPYLLVLPLLAFLATLPLLLHGCSCGHDFEFHLQSWLDAAAQLRHGTLDPAWTYSAAWNAGEPRFLFYPPLSWMLGAALTLSLPISSTPLVFTWLALLGAALAMYRLARGFVSPPIALLASALYIANPYMLFTAFERTAYGELLAAAWLPLLLFAALRRKPTIAGLAIPLALLWLTNAPAAVIGVYTLIGIAVIRCITLLFHKRRTHEAFVLLTRFAAGSALGLALPAFYLLPAAYERRYVQVAMAIIPNMRFQDNFLFGHTGDAPHDAVLHLASLLAISLLAATSVVLLSAWLLNRRQRNPPMPLDADTETVPATFAVLALLTAVIAFLLTPLSTFVWRHLPELAFLQFPWRLLSLLGAILALAVALLFSRAKTPTRTSATTSAALAVLLAACASAWAISEFRQPCELSDIPTTRAQLFRTHHGAPPTDEYTPTDADNDVLRWDDPGFWLSPVPSAFAPGTIPNPAATIVNYDVPPPPHQTISGLAPHHLVLHLVQPETLVLNLRDYPAWQIIRNGSLLSNHLQRDDGLLAVALPAGDSFIDILWHRTWDETLGDAVTLAALVALAAALLRSRTIKT
jgi:hypothetical protein